MTPPQKFTTISLLLIAVTVTVTTLTQYSFYRREIIGRESAIIYDFVNAIVQHQQAEGTLMPWDLRHYSDSDAKAHFDRTFSLLKKLSGVVRIKMFNTDPTIVWSDEPQLVGSSITRNWNDLILATHGEVRAVFIPATPDVIPQEAIPQVPLVEFYVPFTLDGRAASTGKVDGVVSLYRSPDVINATIRDGLILLWAVTGFGGLILFVALYRLFRTVYYGQRQAESRFAKLSAEHGRLMQIEKLSAMGQLISEIAHQLNNPLVGVINLAQLAERELDNPRRARELLGEVRKAGGYCHDFVQRMLGICKVARSERQTTDLVKLTRDTIAFFQQSLGGHPAVVLEAPDGDCELKVDPVLIRNALFNVIHNAALADPVGPIVVSLGAEEREGVAGFAVRVSDSGPGLAPEVQAKLFTPFFTTRPGGTGLGLPIAQHIVMQHGGSIDARNRPQGGAQFTLWLPA